MADLEEARGPAVSARLRADALAALRASAATGSRADWRPLALLLLEDDVRVEEGTRWAERDWENRRDVFAADTLAWARFRAGRLEDADALMTAALQHGTRLPAIFLHAAEIAAASGRPAEARARLAQASGCPENLAPGERRTVARLQARLETTAD